MNINDFKQRFPDDEACRAFLESILWSDGRICPRCECKKSYPLNGESSRSGLYECGSCKRQFTVTTATPMHSTKLPLSTWLNAMYFIVNSSKGISSVFLGRLIGVSQKSAWKIGHAIGQMMDHSDDLVPELSGIVELDEKYIGGKPRYQQGQVHARGKGTQKQ